MCSTPSTRSAHRTRMRAPVRRYARPADRGSVAPRLVAAHEILGHLKTTRSRVARLRRIRTEWPRPARPRGRHAGRGDDPLGGDSLLDPVDERPERIELISGGTARAMVHPWDGKQPDEICGPAAFTVVHLGPPRDRVED